MILPYCQHHLNKPIICCLGQSICKGLHKFLLHFKFYWGKPFELFIANVSKDVENSTYPQTKMFLFDLDQLAY